MIRRTHPKNFKDYTLYVARVLADGTPGMAKPCEICLSALSEFNIKDIHWTTDIRRTK